jgi:hypothetical protein
MYTVTIVHVYPPLNLEVLVVIFAIATHTVLMHMSTRHLNFKVFYLDESCSETVCMRCGVYEVASGDSDEKGHGGCKVAAL